MVINQKDELMKDIESNNTNVKVTEVSSKNDESAVAESTKMKGEKLKKTIIFALMGIVFLGCMYLIFKPEEKEKGVEIVGLNDVVPEASDAGLQSDKQKAYELDLLEQKEQENRNKLFSLSDYWNVNQTEETQEHLTEPLHEDSSKSYGREARAVHSTVSSYQNAQSTLSSFYDNKDDQTIELRKQIEELKDQLLEKDVPEPKTIDDQINLMEKSYELASKYLPKSTTAVEHVTVDEKITQTSVGSEKETFMSIKPSRKSIVSALQREVTDSAFLESWSEARNRSFYTAGTSAEVMQVRNGIKAVIQDTQVLVGESNVRVRLLETVQTPMRTIPVGTLLTAMAIFQGGRVQLKITSIEFENNIIPVDITIYDLDGQQGLYVPYTPEINALTEMASNMSQTTGTSIMMTQSAQQQVASDMSRGLIQGISGYFSKKVRVPKVTIKAGHQLYLVSKQ